MKRLLLLLTLCLTVSAAFSQGASCGAPIEVPLDGSMANHASSSTLGLPLVCTNFSATNTPVTWFSFKTNAAANCPLLIIKANDGQPCEVAFYTSCNGGQALQTPSSMCFDDGQGLWAPAETFVLSANTVYYLRVRTSTACTISIGGQSHVPDNNTCLGATSLSTVEVSDNNACHKPGTGITPDQVCAFSIENTAFYQFYIATTGSAVININNISCDNGAGNNNSGFQIGFFKGSCNALIPINCTSGSGSFVQATTDPLPAGTHVYVAIDGMTGSNCKYTIAGLNIYGVLSSQQLQHFSVWKKPAQNVVNLLVPLTP